MANEELPDFAHNFRRNHHKLDMVIDDQIVQLYKTYAENIIQLDRLSKSFSDYNVKKKSGVRKLLQMIDLSLIHI